MKNPPEYSAKRGARRAFRFSQMIMRPALCGGSVCIRNLALCKGECAKDQQRLLLLPLIQCEKESGHLLHSIAFLLCH